MSAKKPAANAPKTVVADDPDDRKGRLKNIGGSQSDHWNNILANQAVQALWLKNSSPEERDKQLSATVAALVTLLGLDRRKLAVERNLEIVPRSAFAATALIEGDRIEIVAFVGGG